MTEIEKHEAHCLRRYLPMTENEHFRAFCDPDNPTSAECNYAVIKQGGNLQAAMAHIEVFFTGLKTQPRIWSRADSAPLCEIRNTLETAGWNIHTYRTLRMVRSAAPRKDLRIADCTVHIYDTAPLPKEARSLILLQCDSMDYEAKNVDKMVALAGAQVFVAYAPNGTAAAIAVGYAYGGAYNITDVFTLPEYRQQGYGAAVVCAAVTRAKKGEFDIDVFLDCMEEEPRRLYESIGFCGEVVERWWAVKGKVPAWIQEL